MPYLFAQRHNFYLISIITAAVVYCSFSNVSTLTYVNWVFTCFSIFAICASYVLYWTKYKKTEAQLILS